MEVIRGPRRMRSAFWTATSTALDMPIATPRDRETDDRRLRAMLVREWSTRLILGGMLPAPSHAVSSKLRTGFPIDEAMRAEHGEGVVRPVQDIFDGYDPTDPSDRGPHIDRVGLVAVDTDSAPDDSDDDPAPEPSTA